MELCSYRNVAFRYVEKQSQITTSELVDTQGEQLRLEELLEENKPPIAQDTAGLHWLLRSAFRYPPLEYGSRFGGVTERGILYLSETKEALEGEAAFYAFKFYEDMTVQPDKPFRREYTVLDVRVETASMVDATSFPEVSEICDPDSWGASQAFGRKAREFGAEGIRYPSARVVDHNQTEHCNLAVFSPSAISGNGAPPVSGSYSAIIDQSGVRIQGVFGRTKYIQSDTLRHRPFP